MTKLVTKKPTATGPRRNLPAHERRQELLEAAIDIYSQKGMAITVQELADRVHVTQPLVHRYFPTKLDLLSAISDVVQNGHWDARWREILIDQTAPLIERLDAFYSYYLPIIYKPRWFRAFMFLSLSDPTFAQAYLKKFKDTLFSEIVEGARLQYGFPSTQDRAATEREYELVWSMHSSLIYAGIRFCIYEMPPVADMQIVMKDQVKAYLALAKDVIPQELAV
ncbi:AcrR family transcriptional regulator [Rhizobium sp. SG_E_25_P2]|jgi:AcrR family transcriptional regulator|uniref:TetR/AcrR family transcriptional regulator n=1 Tax=Rhizobium sp. SG_E_25_P2 TaxID=2879942 RepID=UPI00247364DE|nr:helix-turn-helix domain-containing protein [Rhizobium sp. SG_E_25_P2]MDH6264655.1 AcrR family transcriptional regulator [Rhizobium sp. SG_E_25_P2]